MEYDPFARQQGSPQPGQQWSPGEQQSSQQPPQPLQWQPGQPPQWQAGQYGSQPQPQQAWGQQPQWWLQDGPAVPETGRFGPRRGSAARGCAILIGSLAGVAGVVIAILAVTLSHGSSPLRSPAITGVPVSLPALPGQPAAPAGASTATLVVTGSSGAQVTYGPAGTSLPGSVPLHKTVALGSGSTYELKAQLTGSGTLECEILVGDKVISHATASGAYGVAVCVIFRDPLSGQWRDATAG
jgi:hypothetical protein